ncbi:hypothetical protein L596_018850 [Steinernema carpocapsae]|uniref:Uncharacterized protein n=1 Tax=Steinernema carpocapsae TaxID=34508 RepID=A0A4U5N5V7_STECR|nr:hypothetical protein L596_018850 [Steinernema carpocapsae]
MVATPDRIAAAKRGHLTLELRPEKSRHWPHLRTRSNKCIVHQEPIQSNRFETCLRRFLQDFVDLQSSCVFKTLFFFQFDWNFVVYTR